jgi:uncharacterized protein YprB with RNaseH-like and TPR domain
VERSDLPLDVPGTWSRVKTGQGAVHVLEHRLSLETPHGRHSPAELLRLAAQRPRDLSALLSSPGPTARGGAVADPSPAAPALPGPGDLVYLDVEATGLAGGAGTLPFLVGIAYVDGETLCTEQLFLRDPDEEPALLAHLACRLEGRRALCTFNGRSFDRPLLATRYLIHRAPLPPLLSVDSPHLDLLPAARRLYRRRLNSLRLSALEVALLDVSRNARDEVGGAEVADRYRAYLHTSHAAPLRPVFLHNRYDVLSLLTLLTRALATLCLDEPGTGEHELEGVAKLAMEAGDAELAAGALERASHLMALPINPLLALARLHERHTGQLERAVEALARLVALGEAVPAALLARSSRRAARLRRRLAILPLPFPPGTI